MDEMEEMRAEARRRWEAQQAEEKLKADQAAMFEMDHMPRRDSPPPQRSQSAKPPGGPPMASSTLQQEQPAAQGSSSSWQQPSQQPTQRPNGQAASSTSSPVYVPPNWSTPAPTLANHRPNGSAPFDGESMEDNGTVLAMCGCGGPGTGGPGEELFAMAGLHPPSQDSFEHFFREWFDREHFPQMSAELKKEMQQRARSQSFFRGLASQVKGWAMANTDERLQSDVWCSYLLQNVPPQYRTVGCIRFASVNLGSQAQPCWVTFWGVPHGQDQWHLPPWSGHEVDIGALLDELDGRGGMAALLAAAA